MINSYIILNRKTPIIIKAYLLNVFILIILTIWGANTLSYQKYLQTHSKILYLNSDYYLEVLVPVKEVNQIIQEKQIIIEKQTYHYNVYKIDSNAQYIDDDNYQKIYLKVLDLEQKYLINGYQTEVKIPIKN